MTKNKMTKEEVIEILKRNVELYRNEPEFVDYLVNLTIYLVEEMRSDDSGMVEVSSFQKIEGFHDFFIGGRERQCHNCGKKYHKSGLCPECGAFNE